MLPPSKSFICWDKRCADNMVNDFADCELAWCSENLGVARMFRYLWNGMMQGKSITEGSTVRGNKGNNEQRIHPTQKPVALYQWILQKYAKKGDKILDTHVGSGSSRIAAYDLGFDFTGYEIDKEYWEAQEKRFEDYTSQLRLWS